MKDGGRLQAAIEVLQILNSRHVPLSEALREWGRTHRFAGSGDRAVIGNLAHDALRKKSSLGWRMGSEDPRGLVLATYAVDWGKGTDTLLAEIEADRHAPDLLSNEELERLNKDNAMAGAPDWVKADVPEWMWPAFEGNFEDEAIREGQALTNRPPLDIRVNTLKSNLEKAEKALSRFNPIAAPLTPTGLRIEARDAARRLPHIQAEALYQRGGIEVQDAGSQIAAQMTDARPGEQVLDFCAGAGGKTLALAAMMKNKGQIHAFDSDKRRLANVYDRIKRAGAHNVQVHAPSDAANLQTLSSKMDRVLVDAPCTGSGVWRRRPDTKWKLTLEALERRNAEQAEVLDNAAPFVRVGGYLIYVTCSVLAEENEGQILNFMDRNTDFEMISGGEVWEERFGVDGPKPWSVDGCSMLLTPSATNTDGFFIAVLERMR